jgi:hypothetical protein
MNATGCGDVNIIEQLPLIIRERCRFVKLGRRSKDPIEKGWTTTANYAWNDPVLLRHIRDGGNYGILPRGGICQIDVDNRAVWEQKGVYEHIKDTLQVSSRPDGSRCHCYVICDDAPAEKIVYTDPLDKKIQYGDFRGSGSPFQLVGPGSIHPDTGRPYTLVNGSKIKTFTWAELRQILSLMEEPPKAAPELEVRADLKRGMPKAALRVDRSSITDNFDLNVRDFLMPDTPDIRGDEIQGAHPVHGSETGLNLCINPSKGVWHCFRCDSGGDAATAAAVHYGLIDCSDAGPGCITKEIGKALVNRLEQDGYINKRKGERKRKAAEQKKEEESAAAEAADKERNTVLKWGEDSGINSEVYTGDDIKNLMLAGFKVNSADIGSNDASLIILLSFMGGREITGDGIHLKVSGDAGAGKSVVINAGLNCLPQEVIYAGAFTPKALVYDKSLMSGCIVKVDESQDLGPDFLNVLKESISSYQHEVQYRTVIEKKEGTTLIGLPARLTWIIVSCDNVGEEQVLDRLFPVGIESRDKAGTITDFRLNRRKRGQEKIAVTDEVMKIRHALSHYIGKRFKATIPFADRIVYKDAVKRDQRLQEFFENCILYHAVLCYRERGFTLDDDGAIIVNATEDDFNAISKISIFNRPMETTNRLLPSEIRFIRDVVSRKYHLSEYPTTRSDLMRMGYSQSRLSNILNGREKRENGLLSKIPGLAVVCVNTGGKYDAHRESEVAYSIPPAITDLIPEHEGIDSQTQSIARLQPEKEPGCE